MKQTPRMRTKGMKLGKIKRMETEETESWNEKMKKEKIKTKNSALFTLLFPPLSSRLF
jgi:hypothetical protein